ncbi:hypothetical protein SBV1_2320008 [Verrucomicrobia bacterium]|nr:hypothetical protein SBV1_2320008 [Verrucomicrobiota bacterium]
MKGEGTPLTGLQDLWDAEPGPALVGLTPAQAFTLRAFSPRRLAKGLQEPKGHVIQPPHPVSEPARSARRKASSSALSGPQ